MISMTLETQPSAADVRHALESFRGRPQELYGALMLALWRASLAAAQLRRALVSVQL